MRSKFLFVLALLACVPAAHGQVLVGGGSTGSGGGCSLANPTGTIGATAVNGSASTCMRSDAAPPLPSTLPAVSGVNLTALNASNLGSGTVPAARGGAGAVTGALKANGSGAVSQAACADLSNATASCATDATNASNISTGTLAAARGGAGAISGIMKANGSGTVSAAAAGSDYAAAGADHKLGTATTVTAAQWATNDSFTSTAAFTLTLPASSTLNSNGSIVINPAGGTVTIQANGADFIWASGSGGSAGGTLAISGNAAILTTDAAGKINVGWASGGGGGTGANPTATASDTAVNGSASTFMRSDGAPAIQKASGSVFGLVKVDGSTITASGGVISAPGSGGGTVNVGTTGQVAYYAAGGSAVSGIGPGTTAQVLHGNASGAPSYTGVGISDLTATGTASSTTYLRGDNTWGTPAGGGGVDMGWTGRCTALATTGGTNFCTPSGSNGLQTTNTLAYTLSGETFTAGKFYANITVAPGGAASRAYSLYVNGSATAITCTITSAITTCSDTAHTASISAGDLVAIQEVTTGSAAGAVLRFGVGQ